MLPLPLLEPLEKRLRPSESVAAGSAFLESARRFPDSIKHQYQPGEEDKG